MEQKLDLVGSKVLVMPYKGGTFVLDTNDYKSGLSQILHQEQDWKLKNILRQVYFGSKSLSTTYKKHGTPKLEMLVVC